MFECRSCRVQVLEKLEDGAVEKPTLREPTLTFKFPECSRLAPPVLPFDGVSFSYSGKKEDYLYENLNLGVDCDSRVALCAEALQPLAPNALQPSPAGKLTADCAWVPCDASHPPVANQVRIPRPRQGWAEWVRDRKSVV